MKAIFRSDQVQPRVILAAAIALLLGWMVVTAASWNSGSTTSKAATLAPLPQDPELTFSQLMRDLRVGEGKTLPAILASADRAARLNPLDGRPLLLHALSRLMERADASPELYIQVLEAARQRNPRVVETRLLLLDAYGRTGRVGAALAEAHVAARLMPAELDTIVRLVAGLAELQEEGQRQEFARALASSPLSRQVMQRLAANGMEGAALIEFASSMRGYAKDSPDQTWIVGLIDSVARRPDIATAKVLWELFYDSDAVQAGMAVTDPEFTGENNKPPFGWRLAPGRAGVAEFRDGALEVYAYGRSAAIFASQLLTLPPGTYRLAAKVTASDGDIPRSFYWRVGCLERSMVLLSARLDGFGADGSATGGSSFTVPAAGCSAQYLQLRHVAQNAVRGQSARIESVQVGRVQ